MARTLGFAGLHMGTALGIGDHMTGKRWVGGALALVEPACNIVAFHLHEKLWKRTEARRGAGHLIGA